MTGGVGGTRGGAWSGSILKPVVLRHYGLEFGPRPLSHVTRPSPSLPVSLPLGLMKQTWNETAALGKRLKII